MTGATGFLGKIIVEKILRSLDVKKLIILVRCKKGADPMDRIGEILSSTCFDLLRRKMGPHGLHEFARSKLLLIGGDVGEENLGLSAENLKMILDEADVFINNAANTKLVEKLKILLQQNYYSAVQSVKIAKQMKKLLVYMHVSTMSVHADTREDFLMKEEVRNNYE